MNIEKLRADIKRELNRPTSMKKLAELLNRCYVALGDGWIPVSERLPNIAQEVIVHTQFEGVCAGVLDSYGEWFAPCSEYKLTRITHWMPLPAAPAAQGGK